MVTQHVLRPVKIFTFYRGEKYFQIGSYLEWPSKLGRGHDGLVTGCQQLG